MGAGELGRAVGVLLREKNVPVEFWDADPAVITDERPLDQVISAADVVGFCVPSWAMRAAVKGILPHLKQGAVVMSFAKGMDADSAQTMGEMLPAILSPETPLVVVGGPMLAAEIVGNKGAIGVFASTNALALQRVKDLFSGSDFRVETTGDVTGVALAGVLKNIYAVALGIADGLELSGNEKGWVTACAIREMRGVATALGVDADAVLGTAGVGDLIATGYSVHSRNRQTGIEIVTTGKCDIRGEGLNTLPILIQRLGEQAPSFPLLMLVQTVGIACKPARPAFESFFNINEGGLPAATA
jgi:glycerol-3-phosphate dehydrogenase (NAD(P)+)